jgi:hypothetical protein
MNSLTGLTAGLVGMIVGAVGPAARWFSEIMQGAQDRSRRISCSSSVMGDFMGFMGTALRSPPIIRNGQTSGPESSAST